MKKIYAVAILLLVAKVLPAQSFWGINFEDSAYINRLHIDLTSHHNNEWQIGDTKKTVFDSGYGTKNSITTNLLHPVLPGDTSVFTIYQLRDSLQFYHNFFLQFWYRLDGNAFDTAKVEISPDNGITWINIVNQATVYHFSLYPSPWLEAGSTSGWTYFYAGFSEWAAAKPGDGSNFPSYLTNDSVIFRFTYTTDTNQVQHDGWEVDEIYMVDEVAAAPAGIQSVKNDALINIYPNPAADKIFIGGANAAHAQIQLFNMLGDLVYQDLSFNNNQPVDIKGLPNGAYIIKYSDSENYSLKKLVINR